MDNKPHELTDQEWQTIAVEREVRERFGLDEEDDAIAWLKEYAYAVRFGFQSRAQGIADPSIS